jgi:hypothetical protein
LLIKRVDPNGIDPALIPLYIEKFLDIYTSYSLFISHVKEKIMAVTHVNALTKQTRLKEVLRIFRKNPNARTSDIAKTLNVKTNVITKDIKELTEELKESNPQIYHLHRERMLIKLDKMMKSFEEKLNLCRGATSGAQWADAWIKLFEKEAKILGIYSPDKTVHAHISLENVISKEQKDAAIRGLIQGEGIIDITPED